MTSVPPSSANLRGAVDLSSLVNRSAGPAGAPGAPGAPGADAARPAASTVQVPSLVLDASDATFQQVLQISMSVPVIVDLWASWSEQSTQLTTLLERVVADYAGALVLVRVDADANPQLAAAFQAQSVPTVAGVIGGQPLQLFTGAVPEEQLRQLFDQVLQLAAGNGVTGVASVPETAEGEQDAAPVEEPLPPHHAEAYDAIERGDYQTAIAEYKTAIAQNPRDDLAVAGLAQVSLLARLQGKTLDEIRGGAASAPDELEAQLLVADLDLSGGHVDDAFDRLLRIFPTLDAAGKNTVRERLLELFQVVGVDDPRVAKARSRLTALLY
ncbi:tetratricopeptide repeat protein [Compostimonas suwonensis]|uniref:Putative thioredoxin n=1 Tax=Compostimonas suwonensis TaxID=1048394 RepID=A0A2M9BZQ2_9MICO|nr:tetratricopeptide repeat protein [Compostimonas suwonensis]PJJ63567.1 putative thioredoxin [Compostimonas suwonensis]